VSGNNLFQRKTSYLHRAADRRHRSCSAERAITRPDIVRAFASHALSANRYLAGSTTKESPYEIEYRLQAVIPKWSKRDCLITTALTDERDFHFRPTDPWAFVKTALPTTILRALIPCWSNWVYQGCIPSVTQLKLSKSKNSRSTLFCWRTRYDSNV
jgi:hypothetical protein